MLRSPFDDIVVPYPVLCALSPGCVQLDDKLLLANHRACLLHTIHHERTRYYD